MPFESHALSWVCSAKVGVRPLPLRKLVDNFEAQYEYVANEGTLFTLKTNLQAPRYRYDPVMLNGGNSVSLTTIGPNALPCAAQGGAHRHQQPG